jgi:hypothetical protein
MVQIVLMGLGAGAAAALLFASVTSGVIVSVFLFYLAPLPIMIAALGWSHWAGLTAAVFAAAILGGLFGIFFFGTFLATIGAPAWWLGYLALLGRPAPNGGGQHMEWYPPGRLVLWAAVLGAALVAAALVTFGGDEASISGGLKDALEHVLRLQTGRSPDQPLAFPGIETEDVDRLITVLVAVLPPAAAMIAAITQTANLWLAGQVVRLSGRLKRPWPDLTALSFPPLAAAMYAAVVAGAFVPDLPGLVASLFAATLTIAFAILGLAVLHATTRNLGGRAVVLSGAYVFIAVQAWPILIATLIGIAEMLLGLRARVASRRPPAVPKT